MERRLAAILAADVAGYSALMERDEAGTFEQLRMHRIEVFEPAIQVHRGRIFKLMGDGILAEFASVVDAVECAVATQREMALRNRQVPKDKRIDLRIGINLGDVIVEGEDRYGEGVNIAARVQQLAEPGGICVAQTVFNHVRSKIALEFQALGNFHVKNIAQPITVFRIAPDAGSRRSGLSLAFSKLRRQLAASRGIAALLLLAGAGAAGWYSFSPKEAAAGPPSIAVLPFDNMSGDPSLGYFGDGVSEDIIAMLARSPDVSVAARNSSFTYKGTAVDVRRVGTELGVDYVLEGSVRKEADKVRIVAQLVDTDTGEHVWADRFDKTSSDPWALQDEVTGKILGALSGERGQLKYAQYRTAWGKDTTGLGEYDYYLRGHERFMRFEPAAMEDAGRIWREGLAKYPDSALLQIKLGLYHFQTAYNGWSDDPTTDYRRAGEIVRQAFSAHNLTPMERRLGHWLFAYVSAQEGNAEKAIAEAEAALALAPYDAFLRGDLGIILAKSGEPARAVEWANIAMDNDPANTSFYKYIKGWALLVQGKLEDSLLQLKQAPENWVEVPLLRAIILVRLNRIDEARDEVKKSSKINPNFSQNTWRNVMFYSDNSLIHQEIADLAQAGLTEK